MKITINTKPKREKNYLSLIVTELNAIINSSSNFFFEKNGDMIGFGNCANADSHNKLIGILCIFFSNRENIGYIGFYSGSNHIVVKDPEQLYYFVREIGRIENVNIEIN